MHGLEWEEEPNGAGFLLRGKLLLNQLCPIRVCGVWSRQEGVECIE